MNRSPKNSFRTNSLNLEVIAQGRRCSSMLNISKPNTTASLKQSFLGLSEFQT